MQTGDRLTYHPERAQEEIAGFHKLLPKAQAAITEISSAFAQRLAVVNWHPDGTDMEALKQHQMALWPERTGLRQRLASQTPLALCPITMICKLGISYSI